MPLSFCVIGSSYRRPIRRLIAKIVFSGFVMLWRLAGCPTSTSPLSAKATIEGVVRAPSEFSMTFAALPSMTATQEFVVPRSMPIAFAIAILLSFTVLRVDPMPSGSAETRSSRRCQLAFFAAASYLPTAKAFAFGELVLPGAETRPDAGRNATRLP